MNEGHCSVCDKPITSEKEKATVRYLGLQGFIKKSKNIQDEKWKEWEKLSKEENLIVHENCRKRYIAQIDKPLSERRKRKLVSESDDTDGIPAKPFDYASLCMICDKPLNPYHKKTCVMNPQFEQTPIIEWSKSTDDEHAKEILRRIKFMRDNSVNGSYHETCRQKCRKIEPRIPSTHVTAIEKTIETISNYIENSGEYKFEISQFRQIMEENNVLVLSEKSLGRRLEEKYGSDIFIDRHIGRQPVYFYKTGDFFYKSEEWLANPQSLSDFDKSILVKLSADIIRHEVLHKQNQSINDSSEANSLITEPNHSKALETFVDCLLQDTEINKNIKRDSISQTIIRSLCLKSFNPNPSLKEIFCYCTGNCKSSRCTCRKTSSKCSHLCKNCNVKNCINYKIVESPAEVVEDVNEMNLARDLPSFRFDEGTT